MPVRIPLYEDQETPNAPAQPMAATADAFGGQIGRAITGFGGALEQAANVYREDRQRLERFNATKGLAEFNEQETLRFEQAKREARPDAADFTKGYMGSYDANAKKFLETLPAGLKTEYEARLANLRRTYSVGSTKYELDARDQYYTTNISTTLDKAKTGVDQNPATLDARKKEVLDLIDQSGLPAAKKEEFKRIALGDLEKAGFIADRRIDPKRAQEGLKPTTAGSVVERIVGIESGGNPNAKNPSSSATGAGQFIDSTWLTMMKRYRPELTEGKSQSEVLALRKDGVLSREMVAHYAEENSDYLRARGLPVTSGNVYLAHFLGPQGAAAVLSVDPSTPVSSVIGADKIEANSSILAGKTAGAVQAWAAKKMDGVAPPTGGKYANIPYKERLALAADAEQAQGQAEKANFQLNQQQTAERLNGLLTGIFDGTKGQADFQQARDEGWLSDFDDIKKVQSAIDTRTKDTADAVAFSRNIATPGYVWNHFDKDNKDQVEAGFKALGGDVNALQSVVDKTGMVPKSAGSVLRGALTSNDATRVGNAMQVSSNLMSRNPSIYAGVEGREDIENATVAYRQYVEHYGMTAQQAAEKIIKEQSPEYKASVKAKIKAEDVDAIVKKQLSVSDLTSAFNESSFGFLNRPSAEFTPEARQVAMTDYAELFKDRYLETGDVSVARTQAIAQLKKVWGVTYITGSAGNIMRYPPDRAPAYAGIPEAGALIAAQAVESIKIETGQDVPRDKLIVTPTTGGQTARAYTSGQEVPYTLSWLDKDGRLQTLNPGRAFVPDADAMRAALSERRRSSLEAGAAAAAAGLDRSEQYRANLRSVREQSRQRILDTRREVEGEEGVTGGSF